MYVLFDAIFIHSIERFNQYIFLEKQWQYKRSYISKPDWLGTCSAANTHMYIDREKINAVKCTERKVVQVSARSDGVEAAIIFLCYCIDCCEENQWREPMQRNSCYWNIDRLLISHSAKLAPLSSPPNIDLLIYWLTILATSQCFILWSKWEIFSYSHSSNVFVLYMVKRRCMVIWCSKKKIKGVESELFNYKAVNPHDLGAMEIY